MKIKFRVHYDTRWGESFRIQYKTKVDASCKNLPLEYIAGGFWEGSLTVASDEIFYRYELIVSGESNVTEKDFRQLCNIQEVRVTDTWRSPNTPANALYSAAFTKAIFHHDNPLTNTKYTNNHLIIRLREVRLQKNECFCLVSQQHGNWDTRAPYLLTRYDETTWECILEKPTIDELFIFKFGIWNIQENQFKGFEDGDNRQIELRPCKEAIIISINGFRYSHYWRGAGTAIPIFSLRSSNSVGCGEFLDLMPLADWCQQAGLKMIQILPINDTIATNSWVDTYPYYAISIMAFHPMFINIQSVYGHYESVLSAQQIDGAKTLNAEPLVDYEGTMKWKIEALNYLYSHKKKEILNDSLFQQYFEANKWWVADYAVFSVLRDRYQTPDFRTWDEYATHSNDKVSQLLNSDTDEGERAWFYVFIQFHLQQQLEQAIDYAHGRSTVLKGDLPIGINPNSVEAWVEPNLFNFSLQAGAPPDFFSASGQNWGFPTYNWEVMKQDGYRWWQKRLGRMQQFFDAFRIDHILGFFRIWSIPKPFTDGIMGHFDPALPMNAQEMKQFNFWGDADYFTLPVVDRHFIDQLMGRHASTVDKLMFTPTAYGHRRMKSEFFNPNVTSQWAEENIPQEDLAMVITGFSQVMREVLFIPAGNDLWHPRIMLTDSRIFRQLSVSEQQALSAIHRHYFYDRHNDFWKQKAIERLKGTLRHCNMLVFGEDLGMIPASVPEVMEKLQILSLEIQRMPKNINDRYGNTWHYPYLSVCTTSTHDISSMRGWWEENRGDSSWYYYNTLHWHGEVPEHLTPELAREIIGIHLQSPSMWCVVPLQDLTAMDSQIAALDPRLERINEPGVPRHYWRYRIPFEIDRLPKESKLHTQIKRMVSESRRY